MRKPLRLFVLLAALIGVCPSYANEPDKKSGAESEKQAYADCGGPPIQDGHDVQPTPSHDRCLADKQKIKLPPDEKPPAPLSPDRVKPPQL